MEIARMSRSAATPQENLHKHLRDVMERHKLPSPPIVVSKVLKMLNDPDFSVRLLSRVISDDPALASRTLAISRSARYAQRHQPTTVHEAILVIGYQMLRNIVLAAAAQSFLTKNNKVAQRLWAHSLGVALAARILAARIGFEDSELAFLTGLLHDVGEMILIYGDPRGFEQIFDEAQERKYPLIKKEEEAYSFDHASIGIALLNFWNIDPRVGEAVLCHHDQQNDTDSSSLPGILAMADYLGTEAGLSFSELTAPAPQLIAAFGCADGESLQALVGKVRAAFDEESVLFSLA
ncbi:MAG TPA: HDOD domain-containing protein [Candidatus Binatia bacterium]|jgi:putative nucleotidyltransferase with HDIG domain